MTWRFAWSLKHTIVKALAVHDLPSGSFVETVCTGRGCAFVKARSARAPSSRPCHKRKCQKRSPAIAHGELNLTGLFDAKRLLPGAHIVVSVVKDGWIGKRFMFTVRADQSPSVAVTCLAPGSTTLTDAC